MYGLHNWRDAVHVAIAKAKVTGRRQRVRWSTVDLCWTVGEVAR